MPLLKVDKDIELKVNKAIAVVKQMCFNNAAFYPATIEVAKGRPFTINAVFVFLPK